MHFYTADDDSMHVLHALGPIRQTSPLKAYRLKMFLECNDVCSRFDEQPLSRLQ